MLFPKLGLQLLSLCCPQLRQEKHSANCSTTHCTTAQQEAAFSTSWAAAQKPLVLPSQIKGRLELTCPPNSSLLPNNGRPGHLPDVWGDPRWMGRQHGVHRPRQNRPCTYRNHCQQRAQQYHHPWLAAGEEKQEHEHPRPPSPVPAAAGREGKAMMPPRPFPTHFLPAGTAPLRPPPARGGDAFPISPIRDKGSPCALSHYYHKRQWMERTAPRRPRPPPAASGGDTGGHSPPGQAGVAATPQHPAVCQPAGLDASPGSAPSRSPRGSRTALGQPEPPRRRSRSPTEPAQGAASPSPLAKRDQGSAPSTGGSTGGINARVLCNCCPPRGGQAQLQQLRQHRFNPLASGGGGEDGSSCWHMCQPRMGQPGKCRHCPERAPCLHRGTRWGLFPFSFPPPLCTQLLFL